MSGEFDVSPDRIELRGVRATGFHGVLPHEQDEGQEFVVDVVLGVPPMSAAARSDDLRDTVDYGAVAQAVVDVVTGPSKQLIESLAVAIAQRCLALGDVRSVQVSVHKPHAPIPVPFDDVAVTITRTR